MASSVTFAEAEVLVWKIKQVVAAATQLNLGQDVRTKLQEEEITGRALISMIDDGFDRITPTAAEALTSMIQFPPGSSTYNAAPRGIFAALCSTFAACLQFYCNSLVSNNNACNALYPCKKALLLYYPYVSICLGNVVQY